MSPILHRTEIDVNTTKLARVRVWRNELTDRFVVLTKDIKNAAQACVDPCEMPLVPEDKVRTALKMSTSVPTGQTMSAVMFAFRHSLGRLYLNGGKALKGYIKNAKADADEVARVCHDGSKYPAVDETRSTCTVVFDVECRSEDLSPIAHIIAYNMVVNIGLHMKLLELDVDADISLVPLDYDMICPSSSKVLHPYTPRHVSEWMAEENERMFIEKQEEDLRLQHAAANSQPPLQPLQPPQPPQPPQPRLDDSVYEKAHEFAAMSYFKTYNEYLAFHAFQTQQQQQQARAYADQQARAYADQQARAYADQQARAYADQQARAVAWQTQTQTQSQVQSQVQPQAPPPTEQQPKAETESLKEQEKKNAQMEADMKMARELHARLNAQQPQQPQQPKIACPIEIDGSSSSSKTEGVDMSIVTGSTGSSRSGSGGSCGDASSAPSRDSDLSHGPMTKTKTAMKNLKRNHKRRVGGAPATICA